MLVLIYEPAEGYSHDDLFACYYKAKDYLCRSKRAKAIFDALENSTHVTTVKINPSRDFEAKFLHAPNTDEFVACWNPAMRFRLSAGGLQSPAMGLLHELGHALQCQTKLAWYELYAKGGQHLTIEDDNLKENETPVASELGEPTRVNYRDSTGPQPFVGRIAARLSFSERVVSFVK